MKFTNFTCPVSVRLVPNRHLLFGLLATCVAASPALKATAQETNTKTPPTNSVIATPSVSGLTGLLAVNAKDTFVYAATQSGIAVIDTTSNTVTQTWSVGTGSFPSGFALTPDGKELYVSVQNTSGPQPVYGVEIIDTSSGSVTNTIAVNGVPYLLSISPDGKFAYVPTNTIPFGLVKINQPGSVTVINTKTQKITHTIPVGGSALTVAFNRSGTLAYVTDPGGASVDVIDTATAQLADVVLVGGYAFLANLSTVTNDLFVVDINPSSIGTGGTGLGIVHGHRLIKSLTPPTGDTIGLPGITPNGKYAYVPVSTVDGSPANFVYLMDTTTYQVLPSSNNITVGKGPEFVAFTHNGKFAYVSNVGDRTVSVIQVTPAQ